MIAVSRGQMTVTVTSFQTTTEDSSAVNLGRGVDATSNQHVSAKPDGKHNVEPMCHHWRSNKFAADDGSNSV